MTAKCIFFLVGWALGAIVGFCVLILMRFLFAVPQVLFVNNQTSFSYRMHREISSYLKKVT